MLINIRIHDMEFDLIVVHIFQSQILIWVKMLFFFGVDVISSVHANNKNKDILILGKRETKGLNNTLLTTEAKYLLHFLDQKNFFF